MIVNHRHRFIFLKTRKTAGTSLEIALSKFCDAGDIVGFLVPEDEKKRAQRGFQGQANNYKPLHEWGPRDIYRMSKGQGWPQKFREHEEAVGAVSKLPKDIWENYFKFTIVRDPYDCIISRYFWDRKLFGEIPDFQTWLLENPERLLDNWRIYGLNGKPAVDFVVRYGHLDEDLATVARKVGIETDLNAMMKATVAKKGVRKKGANVEAMFADFTDGRDLVRILGARDLRYAHEGYGQP